jgi:hypothetical protein
MDGIANNFQVCNAWKVTIGDPSICIAILDGPVDLSHPSFSGARLSEIHHKPYSPSEDGVAYKHGTHITSTIFGQHNGGVKGIAPGCSGFLVPIFNDKDKLSAPSCSQSDLAHAINTARKAGAHIINISAGEMADPDQIDPSLQQAISDCNESGIIVVAAAGNEINSTGIHIPAALHKVIAVGMSDADNDNCETHNTNDIYCNDYILAPGKNILGAIPGGSIDYLTGSSCSAAMVSGLFALLLSSQQKYLMQMDPDTARQVILSSCSSMKLNLDTIVDYILELSHLKESPEYPFTNNWEHFTIPDIEIGEWKVKDSCLEKVFRLTDRSNFGKTQVILQDDVTYAIGDLQYDISEFGRGCRLLPVRDDLPIVLHDGNIVKGHIVADLFLRRSMQLKSDDHIFALLSYVDTADNHINLSELVEKKIKHGHRHVGAYLGNGVTTHGLPPDHNWDGHELTNMKWNARRYPINVQTISLEGVSQSVLNRNAYIVDTILTASAKVPVNTDTLNCKVIDINTTLQFYRDTLLDCDYLHDFSWYTNCANLKTIIVNTFLNLPHNLLSFIQVFGTDGDKIWQIFKRQFQKISKKPFLPADETEFVPLWQMHGFNEDQIQPLSIREYNTYCAARRENRLDNYMYRRPMSPGEGLAWTLETPADVIIEFFSCYANYKYLKCKDLIILLMKLRNQIIEKTNIPEGAYLNMVYPLVEELFVIDYCMEITDEIDPTKPFNEYNFEQNHSDIVLSLYNEPHIKDYLKQAFRNAKNILKSKSNADLIKLKYIDIKSLIEKVIEKIKIEYFKSNSIKYFSSPSIFHKLASGSHLHSEFVSINTLCTFLDYVDLEQSLSVHHDSHLQVDINTSKPTSQSNIDINLSNKEEKIMTSDCPSTAESTQCNSGIQLSQESQQPESETGCNDNLVYAFGQIDYRFISNTRRDSIQYLMKNKDPDNITDLLNYLDQSPHDSVCIQWTLNLDNTPIYVIEPHGPYAREAYDLLRRFLAEQTNDGVERVSIPGYIIGFSEVANSTTVPVIAPEIRGMFNWSTSALVGAVIGEQPKDEKSQKYIEYESRRQGVNNFLERVYYEMRNLGKLPEERALNFAATNAFQVEQVYEKALQEEMELESIQLESSPVSRPDSDCWDVKLVFFYPRNESVSTRKVFRFTVDVADVVPVVIGPMRVWSTPQ